MKTWLIAGAAGLVALALLLPRNHDAPWPRAQAIERAEELARRLGWEIKGWDFAVSADDEPQWRRIRAAFPESPLARWLPAARYRVHARSAKQDAYFRADFGGDGQLLRFTLGGSNPAPELDAGQLPALFAPEHAVRFSRFDPGSSPRPERPLAARKRAGKGDAKGRGEMGFGGGRPEWEWIESGDSPLVLRIFSYRPEGRLGGARIDLELTRALRDKTDIPGAALKETIQGFGIFFVVLAFMGAVWRLMAQFGVRRDYLRLLFFVWGAAAAAGLLLFLAGGPGAILRTAGLRGDGAPGVEGFGFLFGLLVGRPLALAIPLAAGLLVIRGRQIQPWLGLLTGVFRRQISRRAARGLWMGAAAAPALAAIPYVMAWAVPGDGRVLRPAADLLASPFPVFELLRRFSPEMLGGIVLFSLLLPWMMRPEAPSRLRRLLFVLAGVALLGQRMHWLAENGYAGLASLPFWFAGSWLVFRHAGMLGLLAAWLAASALPAAGVFLLAPARFPWEISQTLLLAALPPLLGWWAAGRAPMPDEEEQEFAAEIERRNHPDTAPRLHSEREYLLNEFALAREAQEGMLPGAPPAAPGYSLAARCIPAREVGGDLFDYLHLDGGKLGLCVADVSGKGTPAALFMTLTKGMLAAEQELGSSPRDLARALNRQLLEAGKRRTFVTLLLGRLDPGTGEVDLIRAGHNPALWWRHAAGEGQYLMPGGIGLGLAPDRLFNQSLEELPVQLAAGDVLVLYSDGLTEAMDRSRDFYGEDRLYHTLARHAGLDAPALLEALLEDVRQFTGGQPAHDDLTLLVVKRNNGAATLERHGE